jgi:hypothetical protein
MKMRDKEAASVGKSDRDLVKTSATILDTSTIVGWGVDANPQNDPTYPFRARSEDDHSGKWIRPPLQQPTVELLKSIEHKQLPAVFGTSSPPRWLSGMMRRGAFRWTESNWLHWLILMGADRVQVVEGVVQDLGRGKIPNIPAEMGIRSEWKHNKGGLAKKTAIVVAIGGVLIAWSRLRERE